jgi:hypothetical protein
MHSLYDAPKGIMRDVGSALVPSIHPSGGQGVWIFMGCGKVKIVIYRHHVNFIQALQID